MVICPHGGTRVLRQLWARRWYQYITLKCSNNQTVTQLRRHMLTGRIFGVEIIFLLGEIFSTSDLEIFLCFSLQSVLSPTCQHTSSIQLFPPFCIWCRDNGNLNSHIPDLCIAVSKMPWYRLVGGGGWWGGGGFTILTGNNILLSFRSVMSGVYHRPSQNITDNLWTIITLLSGLLTRLGTNIINKIPHGQN